MRRSSRKGVACALVILMAVAGWACRDDRRIEEALERVLRYIHDHRAEINIDGLFGVVFAQVHLGAILKTSRKRLTNDEALLIVHLKRMCDEIHALIGAQLYADEKQRLFLDAILDAGIWRRAIVFRNGVVREMPPAGVRIGELDDYLKHLSAANITESLSDRCLHELLNASAVRAYQECRLGAECRSSMIDDRRLDPAYGVTHRLLYLQIANARRCAMNRRWYWTQTRRYCSYILWEAATNARYGFIAALDDLLFEQMTLCGLEGYADFLREEFIEHVLGAQTTHGCFGLPPLAVDDDRRRRAKRSANLIAHGCNDHTTGLGAATLALALRHCKTTTPPKQA